MGITRFLGHTNSSPGDGSCSGLNQALSGCLWRTLHLQQLPNLEGLHQGGACAPTWPIRCVGELAAAPGKQVLSFLWSDNWKEGGALKRGGGREFQPPGGERVLENDVQS